MTPPSDQQDRRDRPPHDMKEAALEVVRRLQADGFAGLFAGGCVRDMLMGSEPKDYDVATDARPEDIIPRFKRTQQVGAKFGVVLVKVGRHAIEVATFRSDGDYEDGRRPSNIRFTTAEEDAQRRDFTINGMFFDPIAEQVVDYVGGRQDLDARVIRAIGEPARRFAEDHLRLMRAIRFAARLGFAIETGTWEAMRHCAAEIRKISPERVRMELELILRDPNRAAGLEMLYEAGLLQHLWPGAAVISDQMEAVLCRVRALPADAGFELALGAILNSLPPEHAAAACEALKCSNTTLDTVEWLLRHCDALAKPERLTTADLKLLMAHGAFRDLLALLAARLAAAGESLSPYEQVRRRAEAISPEQVAPPPLLSGYDLQALGLPAGPRYREILDRAYYAQLNGELDTREAALALAKALLEDKS